MSHRTDALVQIILDSAKNVVAVDFDGVLHAYSRGWTGTIPEDPPVPGADDFVRYLQDRGWVVIVHTARAVEPEGVSAVHQWLLRHGFPRLHITAQKPAAAAYIDDRALRFEGDFDLIAKQLVDQTRLESWTEAVPPGVEYAWRERGHYTGSFPTRGLAIAAAEAVLAPGDAYETALLVEQEPGPLADAVAARLCQDATLLHGMIVCAGLTDDCIYLQRLRSAVDFQDYAEFVDDVRAATLRLLRKPRSRPATREVCYVTKHVVPPREDST